MAIPGPPPELEWATLVLVGENFPRTNETLMRELGNVWLQFKDDLGPLVAQLGQTVVILEGAGYSTAITEAMDYVQRLTGSGQAQGPEMKS